MITDIEEQKRRQNRVSVYVDGEFWTGMPAEVAAEHNLRPGQAISPESQEEIERQVAEEAALGAAVNLLSYRDRSEEEMRRRLKEKGFGDSVVEHTLVKLEEYSYLDDKAFALNLALEQAARGRGERAAAHALRQAGVTEEYSREALDEAYGQGREEEAALAWLMKKPLPQTPAEKQKLLRGLASRGFSFDVASAAISRRQEEA